MNAYQQTLTFTLLILGTIAFFVILGFSIHKGSAPEPTSSFSLSPSVTVAPTQSTQQEPEITVWKQYENTKYTFSLSYPDGWNQQEFDQTDGAFVAFSPDTLPCKTCSYNHDGFFSVRVFNGKTEPQLYSDYTARMQNLGKSADYLTANIGSQKGVAYGNIVDVPYHDRVYEITLDKNNGNAKVLDSKVFQKILNSFQFTGLNFSN